MRGYALAVRCFEGVNVAGMADRTSNTWEQGQPMPIEGTARRADAFGVRFHAETPSAAASTLAPWPLGPSKTVFGPRHTGRLVHTFRIFAAAMPTGYRIIVGLLPQAAACLVGPMVRLLTLTAARPTLSAVLLGSSMALWPILQLAVGRGHLIVSNAHLAQILSRADISGKFQLLSHFGLLGVFFEALPQMRAHHYHQHHQEGSAVACMLAATVGRAALQPFRLVALLACLAITVPLAALLTVLVTAYDAVLETFAWAVQRCPEALIRRSQAASWCNACIAARAAPQLHRMASREMVPSDEPTLHTCGVFVVGNERVRAFMGRQLRQEFGPLARIERETEPAAVLDARDLIVKRLFALCRGDVAGQAYRWGIRLLDDYITMSYDDSLCVGLPPRAMS